MGRGRRSACRDDHDVSAFRAPRRYAEPAACIVTSAPAPVPGRRRLRRHLRRFVSSTGCVTISGRVRLGWFAGRAEAAEQRRTGRGRRRFRHRWVRACRSAAGAADNSWRIRHGGAAAASGASLCRARRRARSRHQQLPAVGARGRQAAGFASSTRFRGSSGSARDWRRPARCQRRRWSARSTRSRSAPARSPTADRDWPLRCDRGVPPRRQLRGVPRSRARGSRASRSRSFPPPRRRAWWLPGAPRCSIRACPMLSSSISAAARPRSSGCASTEGETGGAVAEDPGVDLAALRRRHPDRPVWRRGLARRLIA